MKNFVVIFLFLFIFSSLFAQEKKEDFRPQSYFSIGVSSYDGKEEAMKDIYGKIPRFRASFGEDFSKEFKWESAIAYSKKSGDPYKWSIGGDVEGDAEITLLHLEALIKYMIRGKILNLYIGGGLSYINAKEELSGRVYWHSGGYDNLSANYDKSAFGHLFVVGIDKPINKDKTMLLYVEISNRSVKVKNDFLDSDIDTGGTSLEVGIRFAY